MFSSRKRINLALQGGGAHGAFTWGVLDRLLETNPLDIGWVSGTSAGAVNAVALADGLLRDGPEGARAALRRVWEAVAAAGAPDYSRINPFFYGMSKAAGLSSMAALVSPYDFNPLGIDPLRQLLSEHIDFERLRTAPGPELLIAATDVGSGQLRLFRRGELSVEAVLASACLPQIHHAVDIEGRAYWDGGFSANPDLVTLAAESPVGDTLLIQLNALEHGLPPRTAREIGAHVSTITFMQPLLHDIALIVAAQEEPRRGWLFARRGRLERIGRHRLHVIDAGPHTSGLGAGTKAAPEQSTLTFLFAAGRDEAAQWLEQHLGEIGRRQSVDLRAMYLAPRKPNASRNATRRQPAADDPDDDEPRL